MRKKLFKSKLLPVGVVIPIKNSETTVLHTLKTLSTQEYPIEKIIIVDNVSTDNSINKVKDFKKGSKIPIIIIKNKKNIGVGGSYNRGVSYLNSDLIVFLHSDSSLPTVNELEKLTKPLNENSSVIGSYSSNILPLKIWNSYNFWQKRHLVKSVDKESAGMNGKFDCIRRKIFLALGGFNTDSYGEDIGIGGEDADLHLNLVRKGEVVLTDARVIHLHYLSKNYSLADFIKNKKLLARTYGRLIRIRKGNLPLGTKGKGFYVPLGIIFFLIKPMLSILPFIPNFNFIGIFLLFGFVILASRKIYTTSSSFFNPRIILLPFIDIFLIYYESFWMLEAFFFIKRKV